MADLRTPARSDPLGIILRFLAVLAMLLVVAILAAVFLAVLSFTGGGRAVGGLPNVGGAVSGAGSLVQQAAQGIADATDPTHPPRGPLAYDTEFSAFQVVPVGGTIGQSSQYVLTLGAIKAREDAANPNVAAYAVIHRQYLKPKVTSVFGITIRTDRGDADYYLYKGESFRLGDAEYKANWISTESNQLALARYRNPADATALKFQVD